MSIQVLKDVIIISNAYEPRNFQVHTYHLSKFEKFQKYEKNEMYEPHFTPILNCV